MALLQYQFDVIGMNKVNAALATMERRFAQHEARINRATGSSRSGLRAPTSSPATSSSRASSINQEARAQLSIARLREREERRAAGERQREINRQISSQAALGRQRLREENAVVRAERASSREKQRTVDQVSRSQAALARQRRVEEAQQHREAQRTLSARERFVNSTVGRGSGRVLGGLSGVGRMGAAMVGIGGAAIAASSVAQAVSLDESARRLSIQGRAVGEEGLRPDDIRRQFTRVGLQYGINPEEVASGASAYSAETGDVAGALANSSTFAAVTQASGASMTDIATAAAHFRKLGITSVDDMRASLALLTQQGKKGSFELKNMASEFPEVTAQAATFGIRGVEGLKQVGGLMQIAKTATGSGSEASTAVQTMFRQLAADSTNIQSGDAFEGRKVDVFEGGDTKGKLRDFRDILGDILVASRGDVPQLQKVFDVRGIKAINPMVSKFRETRVAAKLGGASEKEANEKGREAALGVLDQAANVSSDFGEIQRDAADAMKATSVQLELLNTKLKDAFASSLLPALNAIIPELVAMVPAVSALLRVFVDLVSWLGANPLKGIGIAIVASIAYELGKARLGLMVGGIIKTLMSGGRSGGGFATGTLGTGGMTGGVGGAAKAGGRFFGKPTGAAMGAAGATGIIAGLGVAAAIYGGGVLDYETREGSMIAQGQTLNQVRGMSSIADVGAAREAVNAQRRKVSELGRTGITDDISEGVYHMFGGGPTAREVELNTAKSMLAEMEQRFTALDKLKDLADKLSAAGVSQETAAKQLSEAAVKLGLVKPNRGDGPSSPVKT